jgi:hypothetical protein
MTHVKLGPNADAGRLFPYIALTQLRLAVAAMVV